MGPEGLGSDFSLCASLLQGLPQVRSMVDLHLDTLICMVWVLLLPASSEDVKVACGPGSSTETPSKEPHKYTTSHSVKFSLCTMITS